MTATSKISSAQLAFVAIALLTLAVHGVDVTHGFTSWDDGLLLTSNPLLNPVTENSLRRFWSGPVEGLYTPMSYSIWAAVTLIARTDAPDVIGATLSPAPFHALNLLLHATAAMLVLAILLRLTAGRVLPAAIGAAVFAVHPLQVEAVAWVSGMNNVLAGTLSLACIAAWLRCFRPPLLGGERVANSQEPLAVVGEDDATQRSTSPPSPPPSPLRGEAGRVFYFLSVVLFVLACLAKPTAMVVPLVLAVIDALVLRRSPKSIAVAIVPFILIAIPFAIISRNVQQAVGVFAPSPLQRLVVAGDTIGFYLHKVACPTRLYIDYSRTPESVLASHGSTIGWIALAVAVLLAAVTLKRQPWIAGSLGVFVAGMCLVLGLVPFDFQLYSTVADRYVYLAMLGPAILVAMALSKAPKAACGVGMVIVLGLAILSVRQSLVWESDQTLIAHQTRYNPDSIAAHTILAVIANRENAPADAERHYRAIVALRPGDASANRLLADLLRNTNRPADSLPFYRGAFNAGDRTALLFNNWGLSLWQSGHLPEAVDAFKAAVNADAGSFNAHLNLGLLLGKMGQLDEAAAHLQHAVELDRSSSLARNALGQINARRGR